MARKIAMSMGLVSVALLAQETKVQMTDLPPAVQKTFYEAETTMNGKSRDVLMDPSGTVVEVEEAIALAAIPEAARKSFQQLAGSTGKILSVESVTKGPVVDYEAVIQKGGKKAEVAVHADGSLVKE